MSSTPLGPLQTFLEKISQLSPEERMKVFTKTIEQNMVKYQESHFTVREGDVFIATFPRSGTTWTQHIVKLIRNSGREDGIDVDVALPWIEMMSPEEADVRNIQNIPERIQKCSQLFKQLACENSCENSVLHSIFLILRSSLSQPVLRTKLGGEGAEGCDYLFGLSASGIAR